jgi:hypothetical protein
MNIQATKLQPSRTIWKQLMDGSPGDGRLRKP